MSFSTTLAEDIAYCKRGINGLYLQVVIREGEVLVYVKNKVSLLKTELLIYNSILNPNSNKKIFKMLLSRYDELLGLSTELASGLFVAGLIPEGVYIDDCIQSSIHRENVRRYCSMGYGESL